MLAMSFDRCQGNGGAIAWKFSKLSAGAENVSSSALSNKRIEAGVAEDGLKAESRLFRRAMKRAAGKFIERNQVDLAPHASQQLYQSAGISRMIVYTCEQYIFEGQPLVRGERIAATGSQKRSQRSDFAGGRHQLSPLFFSGGIERDGEIHAERRDVPETGCQPRRRYRHASTRPPKTPRFVGQGGHGSLETVQVSQRFSHPHEHKIRNVLIGIQQILRGEDLIHDFVKLEVAFKSHSSRQAKPAIQHATDLRRDAKRQPILIRDQHGFNRHAVVEGQQQFARSVTGRHDRNIGRAPDRGGLRQCQAIVHREIGHVGDRSKPSLIDPAQDLPCAIVRPAMRADKLHHLWFGETQERCRGTGKSHWRVGNISSKPEPTIAQSCRIRPCPSLLGS